MTLREDYVDGVDDWAADDVNTTNAQVNQNTDDIVAAQLVSVNPQTDSYTLVLGDAGLAVEVSKATATNVTVPPNSSVAFPVGTVVEVVQVGAGQVTVVAGGGVTVNTPATLKTRAQWSSLVLRKRATDTWLLSGDAE